MTTQPADTAPLDAAVQAFIADNREWWNQLSAGERATFRELAAALDRSDDDVRGYEYGFLADVIANLPCTFPSLYPHAATPVPSATGGATIGGGTAPIRRLS
ncbi:MAG TPA: hypothetical protein VKV26_14460 [Dehalococcoidia bacterium]|nr:hypothetical protein [Dehalococcoidia bacterium]